MQRRDAGLPTQRQRASLHMGWSCMSQTARDHPPDRWLSYNRKFRERVGARKELCWNDLNTSLWSRCLTGQRKLKGISVCNLCMHGVGPLAAECPTTSAWKPPPRKRPLLSQCHLEGPQMCFPFNNKGKCDRVGHCPFIHRCLSCGGEHPQIHRSKRGPV